jgi:predicted Zn finger-like uncharacterized protein
VKDTCPVCATVFEVGSVADSVLGIPEILSFLVRCPTCSTEFPSDPWPEPYDPGPIDPDDVLAPWHRDRARGIPEDRLPGYDAARATWTVYGEAVESYAAATARIDNVKIGLSPDGSRLGRWTAYFLDPADPDDDAAEALRPGRDIAAAWGIDPDRFIAA